MIIINNYREEMQRFESIYERRIEEIDQLPQLLIEQQNHPNDMVNAAANSLRSPLIALKIYLDLLKNFPQEKKKTDVIDRMKRTTIEMNCKINALATLVDIQNEPLGETTNINLNELVENVKHQLAKEINDCEVYFTSDLDVTSFQAKESEIQLLLFHLLKNAFDFRQSEEPLQITIKTRKVGGYYLLSIEDNGIGMQLKNDTETNKLFRPFYKLKKEKTSEKAGIGLSIVRCIVDKYEGEIKVNSRIGEGTKFNIYLKS